MAMYRDFIHSDVPVPQYDACDQTWNAQITELVNGGTQLYRIKFADAPVFTLLSVSQEVVKPMLIGQDMLVTNGTILLNGKLNCSTNASTVRMMVFSDPYCPSCILGDEMIEAFRKNFSASLDYDYHILPASGGMQTMANSYGLTEVNRFALYDICTQKQGLLAPFKDCATLKYRSKGVAAPLSKEELDACLPEALNSTAFDACLPDAPHDLAFDQTMADTYGVTQAPVVLFNCQYRVLPEDLEHGFCYVHPEAVGCS
jgi:protein-disulfide isomerase